MTIPGPPYVAVSPTVPVAVTVQATSPGQVTISPAGLPGPVGGAQTTAIAPAVTVLSDGATIAVNASLGNCFRVTLGGNRTLLAPAGGLDAQQITFEIIQDATGSRTLAYQAGYSFPASIGTPVLSSNPGDHDFLAFQYNAGAEIWYCVGWVPQQVFA